MLNQAPVENYRLLNWSYRLTRSLFCIPAANTCYVRLYLHQHPQSPLVIPAFLSTAPQPYSFPVINHH